MSNREQLNLYLGRIEQRLRMGAWTLGIALTAATLLIATVLTVLLANHYAFSELSVVTARILLFLALAAAVAWALVRPLLRISRQNAAKRVEGECPDFQQRLLTYVEKTNAAKPDPFLELLAADTLAVTPRATAARIVPKSRLVAALGASVAALGIFLWLLTGATGFLGYGTARLWGATSRTGTKPFYDIQVSPGNLTVRKGGDQSVTANLIGFQAADQRVRLMARFQSRGNWDEAAMSTSDSGAGYQFLFAGVNEPVEYYVVANGISSKHYKLDVLELPGIKNIRVTYHYPAWTGLKSEVHDHAGDLSAVEGTEAEMVIEFDRPLREGALALDGHVLPLTAGASPTTATVKVPIEKDGAFHAEAIEGGKNIRISEDFFISAHKIEPPVIALKKPGRDAKVSPLQEVTVEVEAHDEFALQAMELHYSVNGGAEKMVPMLGAKTLGRMKEANGSSMIALEDAHLVPGDVVSLYATARDAKNTAKTDIYFLEAQPYDREYKQGQSGGGGGGGGGQGAGGDQQGQISQRQKEIIAATWNQLRDTTKDRNAASSNAKFLGDMQSKLRDQAHTLAERMRSRELNGENAEFESFVKDMDVASDAMKAASEKLKGQSFQDAMPGEQKALQFLLRAEATFREIQVAFGKQNGGGGGGGGAMGSGRDLESLLDLELDTDKNQYETAQKSNNAAGNGEQRQKEIDEALQKLEQLARRQQELADQQAKQKQQSFQQRWQQELLKREAEELQKRMEQLARGDSSQQSQAQAGAQQPQSGQPQAGQSQAQSGQPGQPGQQQAGQQSGQQSAQQRLSQMAAGQSGPQGQQQRQASAQSASSEQKMREALQRLQQATKDMQRAGDNNQNGQNAADSKRASDHLQEARDLVAGMRKQEAASELHDLTERASNLADKQKDYASRVQKQYASDQPGADGMATREQNGQFAMERQEMLNELHQVENDMQSAAKDLATTQRNSAAKIREAMNNLQKSDVETRMQQGVELMRRNLGQLQAPREQGVTSGLDRLREDLKGAQQALGQGQQSVDPNALERQLAQVGQLRNQLREAGPGGFDRSGAIRTLNDISRGESFGGDSPATRAIEEVINDVSARPTQTAAALEKLELLLRRKLQEQSGQVRAGSPDKVPEGYSDAVADYFRRLTKK